MQQFIHMVKPPLNKIKGIDGKTIFLRVSDNITSKVIYLLTNQGYRLKHTGSAGLVWSEFALSKMPNANDLERTSKLIEEALKDVPIILF